MNGGNYTVLHSFGVSGDGGPGLYAVSPFTAMTAVGSAIYGTTYGGGTNNEGSLFKINSGGGGYTILHSFGGGGDGNQPITTLLDVGSTLYGTCTAGGSSGGGTIFTINSSGGYSTLYSFSGGTQTEGPSCGLTLVGSELYGTVFHGGTHALGEIFSINTNGSGFTDLYNFTGLADGEQPYGTLATDGSNLYGVNSSGGTHYSGVLYRIALNGSGFTVLNNDTNGSFSTSPPTLVGSTLYCDGGGSNRNDIFQINTNGTGYKELYTFPNGTYSGSSLLFNGGMLYGTDQFGGANGQGTVFALSLVTPEPSTLAVLSAGALGLVGYGWRHRRAARRTAKPAALDQPDAPAILSFPSHSPPANAARKAA
jgi:uncharacterized repeat protein (TIGR03803 family)